MIFTRDNVNLTIELEMMLQIFEGPSPITSFSRCYSAFSSFGFDDTSSDRSSACLLWGRRKGARSKGTRCERERPTQSVGGGKLTVRKARVPGINWTKPDSCLCTCGVTTPFFVVKGHALRGDTSCGTFQIHSAISRGCSPFFTGCQQRQAYRKTQVEEMYNLFAGIVIKKGEQRREIA